MSKFNQFKWWISKPELYGFIPFFFLNKILFHINKYSDRNSDNLQTYLLKKCISVHEFITLELNINNFIPFDEKFDKPLSKANERVAESEIEMGGGSDYDLLYYICKAANARIILETGVAYGFSSLTFLIYLSKVKNGLLTSLDMPYPGRNNEEYVGLAVPKRIRKKWLLIRRPDYIALESALDRLPSIDVSHYDSDKSYYGRMRSYKKIWQALRKGGYFISDDICDNWAFIDFSEYVNKHPFIIKTEDNFGISKYIGVLIK